MPGWLQSHRSWGTPRVANSRRLFSKEKRSRPIRLLLGPASLDGTVEAVTSGSGFPGFRMRAAESGDSGRGYELAHRIGKDRQVRVLGECRMARREED